MLNCSTLKVVKKPAGLPDPLGDAGSKCLSTWLSNARLTPGPGACAGKTVGGKAEPPNTESKGNQMLSSCFFPRSNNLSLPPAQRNESDLNWTKPLLVESHASGTVSFHTPNLTVFHGAPWWCCFWKWKRPCLTGCREADEATDRKAQCLWDVGQHSYYSQGLTWEFPQISQFSR